MKETIFEQVASAASVLKLDLSAEEFALFAEDREFSEAGMEAVQMLLGYLSEKKQQTTIQTLLKMSRLPTKAPKTFENFDFSLLKGKDVERLKVLSSLNANLLSPQPGLYWPGRHRQNAFGSGFRIRLLPAWVENLFH